MPNFLSHVLDRLAAPLAQLSVFQRMALFALFGLVSMVLLSLSPILEMDRLVESSRTFEQRHFAALQMAQELKESHLRTRMTLLELLRETDPVQRSTFAQTLERFDVQFGATLARLRTLLPEQSLPLADIEAGYRARLLSRQDLLRQAESGHPELALSAAYDSARLLNNQKWLTQLDDLSLKISVQVTQAATELRQAHDEQTQGIIARVILGVFLFIGVSLLFTRSIAIPLRKLRDKTVALAHGQYEVEIPYHNQPNEIGEMAQALISLKQISSERDDQRWVKERLILFLSAVQQAESLAEFGDQLLACLCPAVGAAQGLFYVDIDQRYVLHPLGAYGCLPNGPSFALGDGLVGQCALDSTLRLLDDASGSLLRIRSGFVDATPRQVVVLPLKQHHHNASRAVIELALMVPLRSRSQLLLDELSAALTPVLEVLQRTLRTERLVQEIQQQAEELDAQKRALVDSGASLQQSNTMLNEILAAATEIGIIGTDLDGIITLYNSGAERLLGWCATELIGQSTPEHFILADELAAHAEPLDAELGGHVHGFAALVAHSIAIGHNGHEWTFVRQDGSHFNGMLFTTPTHSADGLITGYLGIIQDITQRRVLEKEMSCAQLEAEEASRMKSAFLANMSHEIRTPMNAIIGFAHLAMSTELTPLQRDYLNKIQFSGHHLLGIINDILDISKIESGKLEVEHVEFELATPLASVINLIGDKVREKGLQLVSDVADDVPANLVGDPLRLGQILINYTSNALKFTERGELAILVRVRERSADSVLLWFAVRDTGIGLSAAQISLLFTAFTQGDASTTRRYGGTGLGLTIAKRLAQLMGGEVGVDSVLGQGSTFWFTARFGIGAFKAPRVRLGSEAKIEAEALWASTEAQTSVFEKLTAIAGARILVVEDNDFNQQVALELLHQAAKVSVDLAKNGRVALSYLEQHDYDLVLMDMQMPVMDGIAATLELRRNPRTTDLPVIAMTANAMAVDRQRCLEAGMNDFLVKPIDPKQLWQMLLKWIPARPEATLPPMTLAPLSVVPAFDLGIAGINSGPSLHRMLGNTELYIKTLRTFCRSQENMIEVLRTALDSNDWETAQREAHTLKSMLGTIGAEPLAQTAADLEQALAEREARFEVDLRIEALDRQLSVLLAALNSRLPPTTTAPDSVMPDADACATAVDDLELLLSVSNPEALAWLEQHPDVLRTLLPAACVNAIEAAVRTFDLDDALVLLRQALSQQEMI